jgi:cytochrome c556
MRRSFWIAPVLLLGAAAAVAATPADTIRGRVAGYRALGAAFKTTNDTVRAGDLASPRLRQAAAQISAAARNQYAWYPAGSGPQSRQRTAAKAEIWTRGREFRAAQDAFARQATAFERIVAGGNAAAIRSGARQLGASCKGCHDTFRVSDD